MMEILFEVFVMDKKDSDKIFDCCGEFDNLEKAVKYREYLQANFWDYAYKIMKVTREFLDV